MMMRREMMWIRPDAACALILLGLFSFVVSLPAVAAYTQLESIKADGNVWIYSGYRPQCTDRVEISFTADVDATQALYCSRGTQTGENTFTAFLIKNNNVMSVRYDRKTTTSGPHAACALDSSAIRTVVADGCTLACALDGNPVGSMASGTFTPGSAFSLFGSHTKGTALSESTALTDIGNRAKCTLYSFKVYSADGTLAADFVPARDDTAADGTTAQYGLFERVGKAFCKGLGTGKFTPGAQVGETGGLGDAAITWKGGSSALWSDAANWSSGAVPGAGGTVLIPSGKTALLASSTDQLKSLLIRGTLSCTNWETCVRASTVRISSGGKVTVVGTSTDRMTNRVWIACGDCTIDNGGAIDVDGLGFRGTPKETQDGKAAFVSGPGKGTAENVGAAHGGHGGYGASGGIGTGSSFRHILPYDDPASPSLPGSGGWPQGKYGWGTDGGGAVYIVATRRVTVNGSILASVKDMTNRGSCGSGGAINIVCETFAGTGGILKANGGTVNNTAQGCTVNSFTAPGGGGMIAISYDPDKQTADLVHNMVISAEAGLLDSGREFGDEAYRFEAGLGTVWLPDNILLPSLLGKGLTGALVNNAESYAVDGDLEFASGHVRWPGGAARLSVSGNLSVMGMMTRLEIGGLYVTNQTPCANIYAGRICNVLTVGGGLTLAEGGRLDLRGAETNVTETMGARLCVGGALSVGAGASLHCWSDQKNFGSPKIEAASVTVDEGGLVTGFMRGGGVRCAPYEISGMGSSGAHGGAGGASGYSTKKYPAYDDSWLPLMPGAGGNGGTYGSGGCGGGVVHLEVAGDAIINGTIDVNGMNGQATHTGGGGAGGTILIRCRQFQGGENAVLMAKGGDGKVNTATGGGSGAGGRISVWTGMPNLRPEHKEKHLQRKTELPTMYLGSVSVEPGTHSIEASHPEFSGEVGTVRWTDVLPYPGLLLMVR